MEGSGDENKCAIRTPNNHIENPEGIHDEENAVNTSTMNTKVNENENEVRRTEGICEESRNATETSNSKSKRSYWKHKEGGYSKREKRLLVAECLSILCKVVMGNQIYYFGGRTYLQRE